MPLWRRSVFSRRSYHTITVFMYIKVYYNIFIYAKYDSIGYRRIGELISIRYTVSLTYCIRYRQSTFDI